MSKRIRITVSFEYEPEPEYYEEGATLAEMAETDLQEFRDDPDALAYRLATGDYELKATVIEEDTA